MVKSYPPSPPVRRREETGSELFVKYSPATTVEHVQALLELQVKLERRDHLLSTRERINAVDKRSDEVVMKKRKRRLRKRKSAPERIDCGYAAPPAGAVSLIGLRPASRTFVRSARTPSTSSRSRASRQRAEAAARRAATLFECSRVRRVSEEA